MKTKTLLASTLGLILATGTAAALADRQDRENLSQCKAGITALYGDNTRTRLRSIKRGAADTEMRIMVTPRAAGNQVVICSVDRNGSVRLADRDGIALLTAADTATLSKAH
jgi:hypothetical protein